MGVINSELLLEELNKKLQEPSYQHKGEDWYNGIMTAIETISAFEGNQWTSVKEGYPKEEEDVLCCTELGMKLVASYGRLNPWSNEKGWISSCFVRFSTSFVVKWMPLPD